MNDRDILFFGALLHDIGKFVQRAKHPDWNDRAEAYIRSNESSRSYAHKRYSAAFIEHMASKLDFLPKAAASLALWHHRGDEQGKDDFDSINTKGVLLKLLRLADDAAASERADSLELEPQKYHLARLLSPFASLEMQAPEGGLPLKASSSRYMDICPLSMERLAGFPLHEAAAAEEGKNPHSANLERFIAETERAQNLETLLALMEKYLAAIPAQTPVDIEGKTRVAVPDVNLYDHSRSVAAIAVCLYEEWTNGSWKGKDAEILSSSKPSLPEPCLLVSGDLSGIQDFIFDIRTDEKVARSLKGRSFMVQLLAECCAKRILHALDLPQTNVLYNGGGNFYMLIPRSKESGLVEVRKNIMKAFAREQLYLAVSFVAVSLEDFQSFSTKWKEVGDALRLEKQRRFQDIGMDAFQPFPQNRISDQHFDELTSLLHRSEGYVLKPYNGEPAHDWRRMIHKCGFDVVLSDGKNVGGFIRFNSTDLDGGWNGFRFVVKGMPTRDGSIVTFEDLANEAKQTTGTEKIAVLKMDVDNLGIVFSEGLGRLGTISRISSISRSLKWFFEGYINTLLKDPEYRDKIYVVFSGGDDFFTVGPWDVLFDFAKRVRAEFGSFTGDHPGLHLSASLMVLDHNFPVARFAPLADERLHEAKLSRPQKDALHVFGTVLSWKEFDEAEQLKETLVDMVQEQNESRAVIQKTQRMVADFSNNEDVARSGRFPLQRLWRLAYSFRDVGKRRSQDQRQKEASKQGAESIVKQFETAAFKIMQSGGNRMDAGAHLGVIAVAARWAELETRN